MDKGKMKEKTRWTWNEVHDMNDRDETKEGKNKRLISVKWMTRKELLWNAVKWNYWNPSGKRWNDMNEMNRKNGMNGINGRIGMNAQWMEWME